jgi:hypothetical protein
MTPEEKFKKDMKIIGENLRRAFRPTRFEKIIDELYIFIVLIFILLLSALMSIILKNLL